MLTKVKERLQALGVNVSNETSSADNALLGFSLEKQTLTILSRTNLKVVPEKLEVILIDMVVGDFLSTKHSMGQLDLSTFNFTAVEKSVQDGDTTVTYAVSDSYSPEALFYSFIERMKHGEVKWSDYRVIKW